MEPYTPAIVKILETLLIKIALAGFHLGGGRGGHLPPLARNVSPLGAGSLDFLNVPELISESIKQNSWGGVPPHPQEGHALHTQPHLVLPLLAPPTFTLYSICPPYTKFINESLLGEWKVRLK